VLGQYALEIVLQSVNLAPSVLERTLLPAEYAKFSAYLHTPLSCFTLITRLKKLVEMIM